MSSKRSAIGPYLMGDQLTVPDAYLFVILGWTKMHNIDLNLWPGLTAFVQRMTMRPRCMAALQAG